MKCWPVLIDCENIFLYFYFRFFRTPDGDTDFFDIVADVLQGDILSLNLFKICLDYVDRFNESKWLYSGKEKKQSILAQTILDADYADYKALLANTPTYAQSLLHYLKKAAGGIVSFINTDKREYMYFYQNQKEASPHL